jgi:branched-chain amino acid transport system substrate-binding protein
MYRSCVTALLSATLLASCGDGGGAGEQAGAEGSQTRGVSASEIIVGNHIDLSGPVAIIGVAAINGARMKFDEVNEAGGIYGRKIRFIVEDTQYQVPRAIQAVNKLLNRDNIFVMFMGMGTPMNNAIMPVLFEKGVPNLFPLTAARSMSEPFHRLQFAALGTYPKQIRAAVKYFVENEDVSTPCVIYQDTDFGQDILEGAKTQAAQMGLDVAAVSAHKPTDTEFTAAIIRLRNAGCDLVLMGTIHKDTILILETARKMGWDDVQWVGTTASNVTAIAQLESGASNGFAIFQHMPHFYRDDPDIDPAVADWWDRYVERYGVTPEYGAFEGYRDAELLVQGLQNAGPT